MGSDMPTPCTASKHSSGLTVKLWRGEGMCLIGMTVDAPEDDFVGFAIECRPPGATNFKALNNRLAFSYDKPLDKAVTGAREYPSLQSPFQKFRWVHFPDVIKAGDYTYRVTKMHMPSDNVLKKGTSLSLGIELDPVAYAGFLDIGFTRNFASSQAFADRYHNNPNIIPKTGANGLAFKKAPGDVYEWLGFEGYRMIFDTLNEVANNTSLKLDMFAYDFDEPDILALLEKMGSRLRIIIDDSKDHKPPKSSASLGAKRLAASAGAANVKRMHFSKLQHNKVLIVKKAGVSKKVLFGSTNFSFRGLYIQANNALIVTNDDVAKLFSNVFELAFANAQVSGSKWYENDPISQKWYPISVEGKPRLSFCFAPHANSALSLKPVAGAMNNATSSVFFSIAFLSQIKKGPVRAAVDKLMKSKTFSYGIADKVTGLQVYKPNGKKALVPFSYLAKTAPQPFSAEWSGGAGIHEHDKFVVVDFNLPSAAVFTGSCNMAPSGEEGNGDNLVMIKDQRIATSYAIEAVRIFDHLHFRDTMQKGLPKQKATTKAKTPKNGAQEVLFLKKPKTISGKDPWFIRFFKKGSDDEADRKLFSS